MTQYVALYRKYRPGSFRELVGQEAIARTLASAITQQRLAHAYLFCGPRGTGKTSVARILAKSVNCQTGPTDAPCGTCPTCREITNGTNLDVVEIDAASNNGVDNIRDLQDRVALAPVGGRYKIYIIDEVHMLSQGAFNALLKTLEEPPPNVVFVLATTDPHKVLPTIVSRCQRFDFGRIPMGPLIDRLAFVSEAEGIQVDRAGLTAIARRANGGLRDALSLLDQTAAMAAGTAVSAEEVAASLGLLSGDRLVSLGQAVIDGDVPGALEVAHGLIAAGHDHGTIVRELMAHFRHLLVLQLAPDRAEALDVPGTEQAAMKAQAAAMQPAELTWVLEALNETEGVLRRSPQQAIWLELGLIKLARRPAIPSLMQLAERVAALEAAAGGNVPAAPLPRAVQARPHTPPPIPQPHEAPARPAAAARPAPAEPAYVDPYVPAPMEAPAARRAEPAPEEAPPARRPEPAPVDASPAHVVEPPAARTPIDLPPRPPIAEPRDAYADLPPRPPLPEPKAKPAASPPPPPAAEPAPSAGGRRPLPPGVWESVREAVRTRSRPTGALLDPPATVDRWESDGAVVIRIAKALRDILEKQPAKKAIVTEEVARHFGAGAYPRFESADQKTTPKPVTAAPPAVPYEPPPPRPAPVVATVAAPAPVVSPAPMASDEPPLDDGPPAWLDDYDSAHPPAHDPGPAAAAAPKPSGEPGGAVLEDSAVKLAMDLFNGRLIKKAEPPKSGGGSIS